MMNREQLDLYQANAFAGCAPIHDRLFPMSSHAGALEIKGWGNVSHQGIFAECQHANPPHPLRLRARRERPGNCCSANKRGELAPPHVEHAM